MCWVPAGTFTMGTPAEAGQTEDGPARAVTITKGFYIDLYEVTVADFNRFVDAVSNVCPGTHKGTCLFGGTREKANRSQHAMYWVEFQAAQQYCAWVGKRLPTEAEWELAARHDPATNRDRTYPWGDELAPDVTNCVECKKPSGDEYLAQTPGGMFPRDRSAIGAFDMGGNVDEWVSDCYRARVECSEPCIDPHVTDRCDQACYEGKPCRDLTMTRGAMFGHGMNELESKNRRGVGPFTVAGVRCARDGAPPSVGALRRQNAHE